MTNQSPRRLGGLALTGRMPSPRECDVRACSVTSIMFYSATLRTVAHQALLPMGFSRQPRSELPCPPPGTECDTKQQIKLAMRGQKRCHGRKEHIIPLACEQGAPHFSWAPQIMQLAIVIAFKTHSALFLGLKVESFAALSLWARESFQKRLFSRCPQYRGRTLRGSLCSGSLRSHAESQDIRRVLGANRDRGGEGRGKAKMNGFCSTELCKLTQRF